MRRRAYAVAALVMAAALTQTTAYAARDIEWCAEDPVFSVLGSNFRVTTTVGAAASEVDGITYEVTVPSDATGAATAHFPQGHRIPTSVVFLYQGAAAGDSSSFSVTVTITVSGPSGASVNADLSGPSVTRASWSGSAGAAFSHTFDVSAK